MYRLKDYRLWCIATSCAVLFVYAIYCILVTPSAPLLSHVAPRELLLERNAFPQGWQYTPCQPNCKKVEGVDFARRSFGQTDAPGGVEQDIYVAPSVENAIVLFTGWQGRFRRTSNVPNTAFYPLDEPSVQSTTANDIRIACGVDRIPICYTLLRYGQYLVSLRFEVDQWQWFGSETPNDGFPLDAIPSVVHAMDQRIVTTVGYPTRDADAPPLALPSPPPLIPPPATLPEQVQALSSTDQNMRLATITKLVQRQNLPPVALEELIQLLSDDDPVIRAASADALGAIMPRVTSSVSALMHVVETDPSADARLAAVDALARIGDTAAVPSLIQALYDMDDQYIAVQRHAAEGIGQLAQQTFPTMDASGFSYDTDGMLIVVHAAQTWWEQEGRLKKWAN